MHGMNIMMHIHDVMKEGIARARGVAREKERWMDYTALLCCPLLSSGLLP